MAVLAQAKASTLALGQSATPSEYLAYAAFGALGGGAAGAGVGWLVSRSRQGAAIGAMATAGVSLAFDGLRGLGQFPVVGGTLAAVGLVSVAMAFMQRPVR